MPIWEFRTYESLKKHAFPQVVLIHHRKNFTQFMPHPLTGTDKLHTNNQTY